MTIDQQVKLDSVAVPLSVRRDPRARRIGLRVDIRRGVPILVLPKRVSLSVGLAFVESKAGWLAERLAAVPTRVPFAPGSIVPLAGIPHQLQSTSARTRIVRVTDATLFSAGIIHIPGPPDKFAALVGRWLRERAKIALTASVRPLAAELDQTIGRVSVRDPRSRWGSCARSGDLSFSWRLILAPPFVLDYVAAHEVAHLVKRDHSAAFWRVVERLFPRFEEAQAWLAREGAGLHRYG